MTVEWLKLKNYRPFWFILGSYPLVLLSTVLVLMKVEGMILESINKKNATIAIALGRSPFVLPEMWQTMTYVASFFHVIPALLVMLSVTNEFQYRTHRQNLLDGWSRARFFVSKVGLTVAISLTATFVVAVMALAVGLARGTFEGGNLKYLGYFLLQSLSFGMLSLLLAFAFKRGLLCLAFFLVYTKAIEPLGSWMLSRYNHTAGWCTPLECVNALIPFPIHTVQKVAEKMTTQGLPSTPVLLACAAGWLVVYLAVSWRLFRHQDL